MDIVQGICCCGVNGRKKIRSIGTDEKQSREEAERREKLEEKKVEEKELEKRKIRRKKRRRENNRKKKRCRCAQRSESREILCFSKDVWLRRVKK